MFLTMRAQHRMEMAASRQLLQTSSILTEDQKRVTSENQKKVYIAYRAFFKGENAASAWRYRISSPSISNQARL